MRKRYNLYGLDDSHIGTFTAEEILAMVLGDRPYGGIVVNGDIFAIEEDI